MSAAATVAALSLAGGAVPLMDSEQGFQVSSPRCMPWQEWALFPTQACSDQHGLGGPTRVTTTMDVFTKTAAMTFFRHCWQ